jgi:hypothetical protein
MNKNGCKKKFSENILNDEDFPSLSSNPVNSNPVNSNTNGWSKMLQNSLKTNKEEYNENKKTEFSIENYKNYKKPENIVIDSSDEEDVEDVDDFDDF